MKTTSNIFNIFKDSVEYKDSRDLDYIIVIPEYQRKYSWEREDIENFTNMLKEFMALIELGNSSTMARKYFGHIIFQKNQNEKKLEIVDGQQRLTTFLLLNNILLEVMNTLKVTTKNEKFQKINEYCMKGNIGRFYHQEGNRKIINQYVYNNFSDNMEENEKKRILKLLKEENYEVSNEKMLEVLKGITPCSRREILKKVYKDTRSIKKDYYFNIVQAFDMIYDCLNEEDFINERNLNELIGLLEKLEFSYIVTEDIDDAFDIFESINSTGRSLSDYDLIKSRFLGKLKSNHLTYEEANKKWNKKIEIFGFDDIEVSNIFDYLVMIESNSNEKFIQKRIYQRVHCFLEEENYAIEDILDVANNYLKIYENCKDGTFHQNYKDKRSLSEVTKFYNEQIQLLFKSNYSATKPYIFYLVRKMNPTQETIENMVDLSLWLPLVYVSIIGKRPEKLMNLISELKEGNIKDILDKKVFLKNYLKDYLIDAENEFERNITKQIKPNTGKYLLQIYDTSTLSGNTKTTHLEHIYAQKPNKETKDILSKEEFGGDFDEEKYLEKINTLGNFILLFDVENKKLKNKSVDKKIKEYNKCKLFQEERNQILKDFLETYSKNFSFKEIEERTKKLGEEIKEEAIKKNIII